MDGSKVLSEHNTLHPYAGAGYFVCMGLFVGPWCMRLWVCETLSMWDSGCLMGLWYVELFVCETLGVCETLLCETLVCATRVFEKKKHSLDGQLAW